VEDEILAVAQLRKADKSSDTLLLKIFVDRPINVIGKEQRR
jgi:hypothetical protein